MILNLDDLTVTTFATTPGDGTGELGDAESSGTISAGCPATRYVTNCLITCITCVAGCESGSGANC
jgi:hypothetical protein